ncbi:MAG: SpoIIE family protein phosphatase [Butyrivibrio sp.]|nr:SpoIIE family protein phosphatase [Butyrivibrio sp.]
MTENENKKNKNSGLRVKIFRLCILLVIAASVGFSILGIIQIINFHTIAEKSGKRQIESVKKESQEYMMNQICDNMQEVAWTSSLCVYYEIWMMQHAAESLVGQVADILENPDNYSEQEVSAPQKKDENTLTLQLLTPKNYSPSDEDMVTVRKLSSLGPIMRDMILDSSFELLDIIIALPNGMALDMDNLSDIKIAEDGNLIDYDPTLRQWWKGATTLKHGYLANPSFSELLEIAVLEYAVPVYVDDKLVAVVESSLRLESVQEVLESVDFGETGFEVLLSDDGLIIYSPQTTGELAYDVKMQSYIMDSSNERLKTILKESLDGISGFTDITIDGKDYYVAYGNKPTDYWNLFMFVSKEKIEEPTNNLLGTLDSVNKDTMSEYEKNYRNAAIFLTIAVVVLVISATVAAIMFSGRLTAPINRMTESVQNISGDSFSFRIEDIYRTGDEIEVLAGTFEELSERTKKYIDEITSITAEKERIGTELRVAAKIQADMLPKNFPIFPDRKEFDLYATMTPAKEVGGDFYDMFLIDDDHLCIVVGDVSGKGVPAALFMVISKTMIKNRAQRGGKPSEILHDANNSLFEGNDEKMFVTVWLGILTLSTGELLQASAGHEYPVIQRKGEDYELVETENGLVLGYRRGIKYKDLRFELAEGDKLFMYTDGLPEATNAQNKRLGLSGMMSAINRHKDDEASELLAHVKEEVDSFVKEAPQFDDLTLLIIRYNGKQVS